MRAQHTPQAEIELFLPTSIRFLPKPFYATLQFHMPPTPNNVVTSNQTCLLSLPPLAVRGFALVLAASREDLNLRF